MITHLNSDFRPVIRYEKEIPYYYCNIEAKIWSAKSGKFLTPKVKIDKSCNRLKCHSYNLAIPKNHYEDYDHRANGRGKAPAISVDAHRAVMETWRPIDKFPPDLLVDCWNDIPEPAKHWIRRTAYVDHIDCNPANNHVDNLRWVMPIENEATRKKAAMNG